MSSHHLSSPAEIADQPASSSRGLSRRALLRGALGAAGLVLLEGALPGGVRTALAATKIGPGTTVMPYLLPSRDGVDITALLTVRDKPAENGYRMVGIPDGLGIIPGTDTFTLLMNHELPGANAGTTRKHGSKGAFVSRWTIERSTLKVLAGADQDNSPDKVYSWDVAAKKYVAGTTVYTRFCSADMPDPAALLNGTKGTSARFFLNGEETDGGRAWAHIASGPNQGESWELPRIGRSPWENLVATPHAKDKTILFALEDGNLNTAPVPENNPCELYLYIGTKQETGSEIERAGLTNGKLYGVRLPKAGGFIAEESNDFALGDAASGYVGSARFELVELGTGGDVTGMDQLALAKDAIAKNVARLRRIEDGAWDPRVANKGNFYFVTTANVTTNSRLWNLKFDDLDAPEKGGTLTVLLKGAEGHRMLDNMAIDALGRIMLQEDPGNDPRISRVWMYGIDSKNFVEVAYHNPVFFEPLFGTALFQTQDEESSGIIDASSVLGDGWFLADVQSHRLISATEPELVEDGQLLAIYVDPKIK